MKIETIAVHAGETAMSCDGALVPPVSLSTTFRRNLNGEYSAGHMYARNSNPNRNALEDCLAALEGGSSAIAFASGIAATAALFQALAPGAHVLAPRDAYYNTGALLRDIYGEWGLHTDFADMTDIDEVTRHIRAETAMVWVETPSNPMLKVTDIAAIADVAHKAGALLVCDNTLATPVLQQPFRYGADIVVHSTTKYLGGHSDVQGGCVVVREQSAFSERVRTIQVKAGAVPSPFDCWLIMRGVKTVPYRVRAIASTAHSIAECLANHPAVTVVHYPGLPSHPGHDSAQKQMAGFGGIVSFEVANAEAAMCVAAGVELFTRATSFGGVHSLIEHRASIEPSGFGTPQGLLRLSIGLEHADDLIDDLQQALGHL